MHARSTPREQRVVPRLLATVVGGVRVEIADERGSAAVDHVITVDFEPAYRNKPRLINRYRWRCSCEAGGPWLDGLAGKSETKRAWIEHQVEARRAARGEAERGGG